MKAIDTACITRTNASNIKFEENKKKIIFHNPSKQACLKIQVDGCAIKVGDKCDNLLKVDTQLGAEYFVELKGKDVGHALVQIEKSIEQLHDDISKVKAYIIHTNQAPSLSTKVQKYKASLKKKYYAELVVKERFCEVTI